ncbi:MAG: helix-turn-helix domain-containing protein [Methanosarcinales archaeon]
MNTIRKWIKRFNEEGIEGILEYKFNQETNII